MFEEQQKLLASDAQAFDQFGFSVSISADGNTALVGANRVSSTGAAFVFTRTNGTWTEQQKLLASDAQEWDFFGGSVSISADGNTALVGAYAEDEGASDAGAAYVFTRTDGTWTQQQKLLASDAQASDNFGISISISADGNTALVGAYREDQGGSNAGAAYVFTRTDGTWTQQQKLLASDAQAGDQFGGSVFISADGNTAIVGATREDEGGSSAGAAYIFTRTDGTWTQQQKLLASDATAGDYFGASVSISADGNTALVGANEESQGGSNAGAAYIFKRTDGTWTEQQKLLASDAQADDYFGKSVSISADGYTALIGAYGEDEGGSTTGATYIYSAPVPAPVPDPDPIPAYNTWIREESIPTYRKTTKFTGNFYGTISYTDGTEDHFSASLDDRGIVTTNPDHNNNQAILEVQNSQTWLQDMLALISPTLTLNPLGTPRKTVNSAIMTLMARIGRVDGTWRGFTVQYDDRLGARVSAGDVTIYDEFEQDDIITWFGALVGEAQVTI
jgi:N-acetylglucosamine kinase-like BadF-type ATPase